MRIALCRIGPNRYPDGWFSAPFQRPSGDGPAAGPPGEHGMGLLKEFSEWIQRCLEALLQAQPLTFFAVLFAIIFVETGLVVWPFLPGDSLLFFVGCLIRQYGLSFPGVFALVVAAALLGDNVNYCIGSWLGPRVFQYEKSWLFNKKHLLKAQAFYDKYGAKTIILARFVPIVRTFAPFVAGVGRMPYRKFLAYSVGGAVGWVAVCLSCGYWFEQAAVYIFNDPKWAKDNFEYIVLAIVAVSLLPMAVEFVLAWRRKRAAAKAAAAPQDTAKKPEAEKVA
jgi:membrane-associated protein